MPSVATIMIPSLQIVFWVAAFPLMQTPSCAAFTKTTTTTNPIKFSITTRTGKKARSASHVLYRSLLLPDDVYETIDQGRIAVVPDFLSQKQVSRLRDDAHQLYDQDFFITDSLAGYGKKSSQADKASFDPRKDRSVLPGYIPSQQRNGPFVASDLGDAEARKSLTQTIATLRQDVALALDRPGMDTPDGPNNHEISYTRFGPGAYLKRHNDEHHEECKGVRGWSTPTRRSLSWLVYLNEPDWDAGRDGGCLRTFPRVSQPPTHKVGARSADLQIGWLTPTAKDPVERPVFLDGRREGTSGNCALYIDHPGNANDDKGSNDDRLYLTNNFLADPYLFLATDWVMQHVLIGGHSFHPELLGSRFHYVEPPKSLLTEYWDKTFQQRPNNKVGERLVDIPPTGGNA